MLNKIIEPFLMTNEKANEAFYEYKIRLATEQGYQYCDYVAFKLSKELLHDYGIVFDCKVTSVLDSNKKQVHVSIAVYCDYELTIQVITVDLHTFTDCQKLYTAIKQQLNSEYHFGFNIK